MKINKNMSIIKIALLIGLGLFCLNIIIALALLFHQMKLTRNSLEKHKEILLSFIETDTTKYEKLKQSKYYYLLNNSSSIDSFKTYLNQFNEELK